MDILKKINEDLVTSMKSKEEGSELRTSTLRMMKSSIKNAEIAKRGKGELTEEDITGVLSTMVKQRKESVEQYLKANRNDLAEKENKEINIIQVYLPEQLSPEEVDEIIKSTIQEAGIAGMKDMGRLMKELMPKLKGKADGKLVSQRVKEIIEKTG
ncbi:MAG: GatB/YqeY domain-containing protein [Thermodesulfovibrionales bacterium]|nr:GatB/YqeY domain-containing protein [Nitrospinota bacterium]MCG2830639.1 GatB/YqeY domain-containing protein [Desulfobacteraceae bacterium]